MEEPQTYSWFANLPNEILMEIFDYLGRLQINRLVRVNKRINRLAQYVLEHRKKIRLVGDNLRVLVLALPSKYDIRQIECSRKPMPAGYTDVDISRAGLVINTFSMEAPVTKIHSFRLREQRERMQCLPVKNGGKERKITFIESSSTEQRFRVKLYTISVMADMILFIVDPEEIEEYSEDIQEMIFGCCFMMSARNILVAVDLSNCSAVNSPNLASVFNQSKQKISKLLDKVVGQCYKIIPINVRTGCNIAVSPELPNYEWFRNGSLKQLILEDQLRTNFDEISYSRLCKAPLKLQINNILRIYGIGVIFEARVTSGTLKPGTTVEIHPRGLSAKVESIQHCHEDVTEAKAGDVIAFAVHGIHIRNVFPRYCYVVERFAAPKFRNCIAFRAKFALTKPDRFAQHHEYTMFYGSSRIQCIVWWIFPGADGISHDKSARQFKVKKELPKKPEKNDQSTKTLHQEWRDYTSQVHRVAAEHKKCMMEQGKDFERPPKPKMKKVEAIVFPLMACEIQPYRTNQFEKNYSGKLMIVEKKATEKIPGIRKKKVLIVGVGRVDFVIRKSAETIDFPSTIDFKKRYQEVIDQAERLFKLPREQNSYATFLNHVKNDSGAKNCIQQREGCSEWKARH